MEHGPISFPDWKLVLARAGFAPDRHSAFAREIIAFLRHCKAARSPVTAALARQYLVRRESQTTDPAREALRWFYREGKRRVGARPRRPDSGERDGRKEDAGGLTRDPGVEARRDAGVPAPVSRRPMEPPPAASDLGTAPWERDLIRAIRERHFLWRTEQTCREWAVRFARFIAPRSPYAAGGDEVAAFLSGMAVQGRAGPSAQKQALNALVFLMLEALHRDLGQLEFTRPVPPAPRADRLTSAPSRNSWATPAWRPLRFTCT